MPPGKLSLNGKAEGILRQEGQLGYTTMFFLQSDMVSQYRQSPMAEWIGWGKEFLKNLSFL